MGEAVVIRSHFNSGNSHCTAQRLATKSRAGFARGLNARLQNLASDDLSHSAPQKLCEFPDRILNLAWARYRKYLAVSRGKLQDDALVITNLP